MRPRRTRISANCAWMEVCMVSICATIGRVTIAHRPPRSAAYAAITAATACQTCGLLTPCCKSNSPGPDCVCRASGFDALDYTTAEAPHEGPWHTRRYGPQEEKMRPL